MRNGKPSAIPAPTVTDGAHWFFKVNKRRIKVYFDDLLFIESQKAYIKVITHDRTITTQMPLHQVDGLLPDNNFLRLYLSFMVPRNDMDAFTALEVKIGGHLIPMGRSYKEPVQAILR